MNNPSVINKSVINQMVSNSNVSLNKFNPDSEIEKHINKTVIGRSSWSFLKKYKKIWYPIEYLITTEQIFDKNNNPIHGITETIPLDVAWEAKEGVKVTISLYNIDDRMNGWTKSEIINIVCVHERFHIQRSDKLYKNEDLPVIAELQSRFEYSLLNKSISTSKSVWFSRYMSFFTEILNMPQEEADETLLKTYIKAVKNLKGIISNDKYKKYLNDLTYSEII